jgi:hypothetical protein
MSTPAIAIPARGLVRLASTTHSAVNSAIVALLLTGHADKVLAPSRTVTPAELAGHRIWMPGIGPGTEWGAFYEAMAAAFGLTIEVTSPDFGTEPLLDTTASGPAVATFVGEQTRLTWPGDWDLRRIGMRDPTPVYPHSLIWRGDNPHPRSPPCKNTSAPFP